MARMIDLGEWERELLLEMLKEIPDFKGQPWVSGAPAQAAARGDHHHIGKTSRISSLIALSLTFARTYLFLRHCVSPRRI